MKSTYRFEDLVDATLRNYRTVLANNITGESALWTFLKQKGYINEKDSVGIVSPLY